MKLSSILEMINTLFIRIVISGFLARKSTQQIFTSLEKFTTIFKLNYIWYTAPT